VPGTRWLVAVALAATALVSPIAVTPAHAAVACGPRITAPLPDEPWPLRRLRPDLVWPIADGSGVTVAVIDSGSSRTHPALEGQVLDGIDLVKPGQLGDCDEAGHGTTIAGIIAGKPTPDSAFHGIAPGARILPIRALQGTGDDQERDSLAPGRIASAVTMATDRGADIINLSLTTAPIPALAAAVRYAQSKDVVVIAAVGNNPESEDLVPSYPASFPGVVGVAGVGPTGDYVPSSVQGNQVDISAPGLLIAGPAPQGGGFLEFQAGGTSFASAYVSGAMALLRSARPDLSANAAIRRLLNTADRPPDGWDNEVGNGVVNPTWAVNAIVDSDPGPQQLGRLTLSDPVSDPMAGTRTLAVLVTLGATMLSALVLTATWVVRRGRRRRWRPGDVADYSAP